MSYSFTDCTPMIHASINVLRLFLFYDFKHISFGIDEVFRRLPNVCRYTILIIVNCRYVKLL